MSHGDQLDTLPPSFQIIGRTDTAPYAAIVHDSQPFFGIQFHPEVTHSAYGKKVIENFVLNICGCRQGWTMVSNQFLIIYDLKLSIKCSIISYSSYRKNLLGRKLSAYDRYVVLKVESSVQSVAVWTVR